MSDDRAKMSADRELWRQIEGDYYAPSIHVTATGLIGINVGGYVAVKSLRDWHALALPEAEKEKMHAAVRAAQGMSTGTAKTAKPVEGRSPASPVAESDAPNPEPSRTYRDGVEDAAKVAEKQYAGHGSELGTHRAHNYEHAGKSIAAAIRSLAVKPSGSENG